MKVNCSKQTKGKQKATKRVEIAFWCSEPKSCDFAPWVMCRAYIQVNICTIGFICSLQVNICTIDEMNNSLPIIIVHFINTIYNLYHNLMENWHAVLGCFN